MSSDTVGPHRQRAKARRVPLACLTCRARKTRCDGRQPVCVACQTRGAGGTCSYERNPRKRPPGHRRSTPSSAVEPANAPPSPLPASPGRIDDVSGLRRDGRGLIAGTLRQYTGDRSIDGLATIPSYSDEDNVYGPSSSIAFSRFLIGEPASRGTEGHSKVRSALRPPSFAGGNGDRRRALDDAVAMLPRRKHADDFIRCFWEFIHPVFPILHKTTFIAQYDGLWSSTEHSLPDDNASGDADDIVFMSILNLVFALGCKFSSKIVPTRKEDVADDFYQRSWQGYSLNLLDSTSPSVVQMLLLNGVYLQSTRYARRCWNAVGLAIRVAQSLGLHHEDSGNREPDQLRKEMGRRIWHNCVALDRLLSMTFGRPLMISDSVTVPIPSTIDDEYLSSSHIGTQPSSIFSYISLFAHSCYLFDILKDVLQLFTIPNATNRSHHRPAGDVQSLERIIVETLDINRRLDRFMDSIPRELLVSIPPLTGVSDRHHTLNLMQQVLYCRVLYVRLLSMRPLLIHAVRHETGRKGHLFSEVGLSSFDHMIMQQICQQCVDVAHKLISTIFENIETPYRSAGWHAVYFTFSAATSVLVASRHSLADVNLENESFKTFWNQCLSILTSHETSIVTAGNAVNVLEAIKKHLLFSRSRPAETTRGSLSNNVDLTRDSTDAGSMAAASLNGRPPEAFELPSFFDVDNLDVPWLDQWFEDLNWLAPAATWENTPSRT